MRLRAEDGYTLTEVLVVMAILPFVLVAMLNMLDTSAKLAPRSVQYAAAVREAGNGLSRAIREIRQAYRVIGTTPNSLTFLAFVRNVETQVSITCNVPSPAVGPGGQALRRCVRTAAPVGLSLPSPTVGAVLVDRMTNGTTTDPVFAYTPNAIAPTFVRMQVRVPSRGESTEGRSHPITIDDGTQLRNNAFGT